MIPENTPANTQTVEIDKKRFVDAYLAYKRECMLYGWDVLECLSQLEKTIEQALEKLDSTISYGNKDNKRENVLYLVIGEEEANKLDWDGFYDKWHAEWEAIQAKKQAETKKQFHLQEMHEFLDTLTADEYSQVRQIFLGHNGARNSTLITVESQNKAELEADKGAQEA